MHLGQALHQVARGRLFARRIARVTRSRDHLGANASDLNEVQLLVGVVEVPKHIHLESMHAVRVNTSLWLDVVQSSQPTTYLSPAEVKECPLGHLMESFSFGVGSVPDAGTVFLRGTLLPPSSPNVRWAYVAGAMLPLDQFQENGIYEFGANQPGFRRVGSDTFNGCSVDGVLRMPLWGDDGQWGTSTSMEPECFPTWLAQERARRLANKREAEFLRFAQIMGERCPELHAYTADQYAERELLAKRVIREVIGERAPARPRPAA